MSTEQAPAVVTPSQSNQGNKKGGGGTPWWAWVVMVLGLTLTGLLVYQIFFTPNVTPSSGGAPASAGQQIVPAPVSVPDSPASQQVWTRSVEGNTLIIVGMERVENDPIDGTFWLPIGQDDQGRRAMLASKPGLPAPLFQVQNGVPIPGGHELVVRKKPHASGMSIWVFKPVNR